MPSIITGKGAALGIITCLCLAGFWKVTLAIVGLGPVEMTK